MTMNTLKRYYWVLIISTFSAVVMISCSETEGPIDPDEVMEEEPEIVAEKPKLFDIDDNEYSIDEVAGRQWMVENLKTSRYRNGDLIPNVTDPKEWSELESGAFAWFNNDPKNEEKLGKLYNWYAVTCCPICPEGWRIPTKLEYDVLLNHYRSRFWDFNKGEKGTEWTNFKSIGAERRNLKGEFERVMDFPNTPRYLWTGFWSSNLYNEQEAFIVNVYALPGSLIRARIDMSFQPKKTGISVKCIKEI